MDNFTRFANVGETLQALNRQVQESATAMQDDRGEIQRLRDKNDDLMAILQQERDRALALTEEKNELLRQIDRLDNPRAPGFTMIPTWHPSYRNKHEASESLQTGSALNDREQPFVPIPKIDTEHIRSHIWKVSQIELTALENPPDGSDHVLPTGCDETKPNVKNEDLNSLDIKPHEQHKHDSVFPSIEISTPPRPSSITLPAKRAYSPPPHAPTEPAAKRRHLDCSDAHPHQPRHSHRRKAVCVCCWIARDLCDFNGQCNPCRSKGVQCVRLLCSSSERCSNPRCPCLHAGEWDESDPEWIVREADLPKRKPPVQFIDRYVPKYE